MIVATVVGNLGRDGELKSVGGDSVLEFSIASNRGKDDPPTWVRCSVWGRRADSLAPYLLKGTSVTVVGELSAREFQKRDGSPGFGLDLRVDRLKLGSKRDATDNGEARAPGDAPPPTAATTDDIPF